MTQNAFGKKVYSVCEKIRWDGTIRNNMRGGYFHVGTDNLIHGGLVWQDCPRGEEYENPEFVQKYLLQFEKEVRELDRIKLSVRTSVPIYSIQIKRATGNKS